MNILLLDNYDSFTYNLSQMIEQIVDKPITILQNDKIQLNEVKKFDKIVLSPGPGVPSKAGLLLDIIQKYAKTKPILGVCLGHQAIAEAFGGTLINTETVTHGEATETKILKESSILFRNIPQNFKVGRYHSWVVNTQTTPDELEITAIDFNGNIMACEHRKYPIYSVQFHPESILTPFGRTILSNFLLS